MTVIKGGSMIMKAISLTKRMKAKGMRGKSTDRGMGRPTKGKASTKRVSGKEMTGKGAVRKMTLTKRMTAKEKE